MTERNPEIRFPQFNEPWKSVRLGDIATFSKGKGVSKADVHENGATKCIRYGELYTHYSELPREIKSATDVPVKELTLSHANDVLIPASGESAIDMATATCLPNSGIAIGSDINIIRSELDGAFLAYYLNNTVKHDIARFAQGISVMHLYAAQLKLLKLRVPSNKNEAKKLGEFFSTLDEKVSLLKEKHALLQQYKKGVMQKLFSQEIRFKDENGKAFPDWKILTLSKLAKKNKSKNINSLVKNVLTNSAKSGIVPQGDYFTKDIANQGNLDGYTVVQLDDFVYNPRISELAPVGPISRNHVGEGVMSPLYTVFRFNDKDLLDYVEQYFATSKWHRYMHSVANFGARHDRMNIGSEDFYFLPIPVPSKPERDKIVSFIKALEAKLNSVQRQIELTQTFKKGLLQQMFV